MTRAEDQLNDYRREAAEAAEAPAPTPTFDETYEAVVAWAKARGILPDSPPQAQLLKTVEELGELASAINKSETLGITDGLGDVLVTLVTVAEACHLDLRKCFRAAYNEIAGRTGRMVNGVFVKDAT